MKNLTLLIVLSGFAVGALAQPPRQQGAEGGPAPTMQQMQSRMQQMQAHMERIRQTEDPAERRRLMQEHREAMREGMGMMGRMMQENGMQQRGRVRDCPADDTDCRLQRMETRHQTMLQQMQMMQQMMEQMMGGMIEAEEGGDEAHGGDR